MYGCGVEQPPPPLRALPPVWCADPKYGSGGTVLMSACDGADPQRAPPPSLHLLQRPSSDLPCGSGGDLRQAVRSPAAPTAAGGQRGPWRRLSRNRGHPHGAHPGSWASSTGRKYPRRRPPPALPLPGRQRRRSHWRTSAADSPCSSRCSMPSHFSGGRAGASAAWAAAGKKRHASSAKKTPLLLLGKEAAAAVSSVGWLRGRWGAGPPWGPYRAGAAPAGLLRL